MWSNFFARDEEGRPPPGYRGGRRADPMSDSKEGSVKLSCFLALVGLTLTVLAVGTDFWAELNGGTDPRNATCRAAYFGLWRHCLKTIELLDLEPGRQSCGPVELPGETNCSYYRFFTTGEHARIMERQVEKDLFIVMSVFALLSLCLMILGCLATTMALNRRPNFLIKLSAFFFISAGLVEIAALCVFRRACADLLRSNQLPRVDFAYMWSFACAAAAAAIVIFSGVCLLLIVYPGVVERAASCCRRNGGSA